MISDVITKKFAISPTPLVELPIIKRISSLTAQIIIPAIGPYINPPRRVKTAEKSSFKNDAAGKIGNSNSETTNESAEKSAIPTTF